MRATEYCQPVSRDLPRKRTTRDVVVVLSSRTAKNQELAQIRLCPKIQFKFDLEKVVQNKNEQKPKFSSLQFWKVTFLSRDYSVTPVRAQAQPKVSCLAKGCGSRWSVLTVLFLMNSWSGTSA